MLKEEVTYKDFNDQDQTETLYFNLTKTEMIDLMYLKDRLENWSGKTAGPDRDLTTDELKEMLDIVKILIEAAYGERSEDGKHFLKSPEIFAQFKGSAVYDEFVFGLFRDPRKSVSFMINVLPKDLVDQSDLREALDMIQAPLPSAPAATPAELNHTEQEVPDWILENREPSKRELVEATPEQLRLAFQRKSQQLD